MKRRSLARVGVATLATSSLCALASAAGAALPRATVDRADDRPGPQVHVLYVVPRDGVDRQLDTNSVISASVRLWQQWLRGQTGGKGLMLDTYQGELDVSFFRLATDDAIVAARGAYVREQIEEEIFASGFSGPTKIYAVYYDGSSTWSCGGGDPEPSVRGSVAAMYLKGTPPGAPPCSSNRLGVAPPGYFEFGMLHEIIHTLGFVPSCALHALRDYPAGHVSDSPFDLMWSGNAPWRVDAPEQMRLDIGRDDYYGHGRSDCPDLANSPYLAAPEMVQLTVAVSGRGAGRVGIRPSGAASDISCPPTCAGAFIRGDDVTLTAVPDQGSSFEGWEGACSGTVDPCTVALNEAKSVTARFTKNQYEVVVSVRGPGRIRFGSASCSRRCTKTVEHASVLVFRAIPRSGATFVGWRGACRGVRACRIVVARPASVTAQFRR